MDESHIHVDDIMDQCDTKFYLIKYMKVSDIYFVSAILLNILKDIDG